MRITAICLCLVVYSSVSADEPPSKILDLSDWRLTLPVDTARAGEPDEVSQPDLKTFIDPRFFFVDKRNKGVVFRAHCGGYTTKTSGYPRSELRQMTEQGTKRASWDTSGDSIHTMRMRVAITATPTVKQHVVCAQIHTAEDDLLMIRLEGTKLFIERNSSDDVMLNRKYQLGTPFDLKIQAGAGEVNVWYDGELSLRWDVASEGCYFKAGCYTQSNLTKGDSDESYGEVTLYKLLVESEVKQ